MKPQFVAMPYFGRIASLNLTYVDILTYAIIRSFAELQNNYSPTREDISSIVNLPPTSISRSIARLIDAEFLESTKSEDSEVFSFGNKEIYSKVPYEILNLNLTNQEKVILLCLKMEDIFEEIKLFKLVGKMTLFANLALDDVFDSLDNLIFKDFIDIVEFEGKIESMLVRPSDTIKWHDTTCV